MKKFLITEDEKNQIRKLYNLNEIDTNKILPNLIDMVKKMEERGEFDDDIDIPFNTSSDFDGDKTQAVQYGEYYTHPNVDSITLNYRPNAIKLNQDAEKLLKSIFAAAQTPNLEITSTLRTYEDQARVNLQNSRSNIASWYGGDVVKVWDKYKAGQMTQQQYADYLRDRDKQRGKLMSNHLSGLAIDVVPYSDKFASTAEKLMKQSNSGIKKVLREKSNNTVHIEFTFPVTDKRGVDNLPSGSPTKRSERKSDKAIYKQGIVIDTKDSSLNEYGLVYGGTPSDKYGAQFMYNEGKNILNKNVVYVNNEIPISAVEQELKLVNPNARIKSVSGFSGGGSKTIEAMNSGRYDFIGLIDPFIKQQYQSLPNNVKMISRGENWTGYPKVRQLLKNMENTGVSELITANSYNHNSMPKTFFEKYGQYI
jgi:pantothenate kinase type III